MLSAFQMSAKGDFPERIFQLLEEAGYRAVERGYDIEAYRPGLVWDVPSVGTLQGGCRLSRIAGGGGGWVVVLPHWGIPGIELTPTSRASADRKVMSSSEFSPAGRLEECFRLIRALGMAALPEKIQTSVMGSGRVILGSGPMGLGPVSMGRLKGAPLHPPFRRHLHFTSQSHDERRITPFRDRILTALGGMGVPVSGQHFSFERFRPSLLHLTPAEVVGNSVVLISVSGSKTDRQPIPSETLEALDRMDALGIPYRVFGDPSLTETYAPNDMAAHLAMLLGASMKELELAPGFAETMFLGLDLGHPLHRGDSVPVLSIVDSRGRLLAWWRGRQIRDETMRRDTLERAAAWLLDWLQTTPQPFTDFVVLRDGKLNKHDGLEVLARVLPGPTMIVEVVKRPVPLMATEEVAAAPSTWIEVVPGLDGFLQMPEPTIKGHTARPLRLRLPNSGSRHTLAEIAGAVFALCHAPTLGMKVPSAPAPIYWSDGLAANAGLDLQFRGLNHVHHHDELRC